MRIGLATLDKTNRITFFNPPAERILGYCSREAQEKLCEDIFPGSTDLVARLRGKCPDGKRATQWKRDARHKDGRGIPLLMTAYVTADNDDPPTRGAVILVFQEAQELEKMEDQLQHLDRLQSLDQFAAGIVHELRNPLAGISTNAQYMLEKIGPSDPFHEEMRDILADVKEIESVVNKVLDFARPGTSDLRDVLIADIVNEVLRFSRLPLRRRDIRLLTNLEGSSARVRADVSQMKQVFFNIIRNACDAMPDGGTLRVSTIRLPADNGHVRVEVEDTGRGIAAEYLERIFDPFFSTHRDGTGLGLAISRRVVENHGGRIEVKSRPGKGSSFRVVLPIV